MRKILAEMPAPAKVVPAIVEQKRIDLHAARFTQLAADCVDALQRLLLRVRREVANVAPAVVVQKRAIRVSPLPFQIGGEVAPQLARAHYAGHGGVNQRPVLFQRQCALQSKADVVSVHMTFRQWQLETQIEVARDDRRALQFTAGMRVRSTRLQQ